MSPTTELVFVDNYFLNSGASNIGSNNSISPGIVKIYSLIDNKDDQYDILNSNKPNDMLTSSTRNINLGKSPYITVSIKIIKIETINDFTNKWYLFRIKNTSSSISLITLIFSDIEMINIINLFKESDKKIEEYINNGNINKKYLTNQQKENKIFCDIPLPKKSVSDLCIMVKMKI